MTGRSKGGVAVLAQSHLPVTGIHLNTTLQAMAVRIVYPFPFTLCNIYLPHPTWTKDDIRHILLQLPTPYLIVGDFNSHNIAWGSIRTDSAGERIENIVDEFNLTILNNGDGTYLNSKSHNFSAIDLSICTPSLAPKLVWKVLNNQLFSDHFPVEISMPTQPKGSSPVSKWNIRKANWSKYQEIIDIPDISNNVNDATRSITTAILAAASSSVPISNHRRQGHTVPWWNEAVKLAIHAKKRALNKFKRSPTLDNMITFKKMRAKAKRIIMDSKKLSWREFTASLSPITPVTDMWRKVRSITGKHFSPPSPVLQVGSQLCSDPHQIPCILAEHFQHTCSSQNYSPNFVVYKKQVESLPFHFTSQDELSYNAPLSITELQYCLSHSKQSSPGPDTIPYLFIQKLPPTSKIKILKLFNLIFDSGVYPESWREAIIIPVLKPGKNPQQPASYRPISLTCCLSKLMEKMMNFRLMWFLEEKQLLSPYQMGFRRHRSTVDATVFLESYVQSSFSHRTHTTAILFDLEKAYDLTWRHGILLTLIDWGIQGKLFNFVKNFLTPRFFRVKIGSNTSQQCTQENGVPQGSPLSVTLFAIAINKLASSIPPPIRYCLYVDDLTIFYSCQSIEALHVSLQETVVTLTRAAENLGFRFSPSKTQAIHFCRLRKPHDLPPLLIHGNQIEFKSQVKLLGITFDEKLRWHPHITEISAKCKAVLNIMRCTTGLTWGAERETLLRIYRALILSKIDYCSVAYGSARHTALKPLEAIQNAAVRLCTGAFRTTPVESLLCESGNMPLSDRRRKQILNYGLKILAQPNHPNFQSFDPHSDLIQQFRYQPTLTRPAPIRFHEALKNYQFNLSDLLPLLSFDTPPWRLQLPRFRLDCTLFPKESTPNFVYDAFLRSILNDFQPSKTFYTDGSKTNTGVGSAFAHENRTFSWSLPKTASIYSAELYAIWQTLLYIMMTQEPGTFLVCTDSRSSLQALNCLLNADTAVYRILCLYTNLDSCGKHITFAWVPSHTGIPGNELADIRAKEAANQRRSDNISLPVSDFRAVVSQNSKQMWQETWNRASSQLKILKPSVAPWIVPCTLTRKEQVLLTRLRLGHTNVTHNYLMNKAPRPVCHNCHSFLTVKHILIDCPIFEHHRRRCELPHSLNDALNDSSPFITAVLKYISLIDLPGPI